MFFWIAAIFVYRRSQQQMSEQMNERLELLECDIRSEIRQGQSLNSNIYYLIRVCVCCAVILILKEDTLLGHSHASVIAVIRITDIYG